MNQDQLKQEIEKLHEALKDNMSKEFVTREDFKNVENAIKAFERDSVPVSGIGDKNQNKANTCETVLLDGKPTRVLTKGDKFTDVEIVRKSRSDYDETLGFDELFRAWRFGDKSGRFSKALNRSVDSQGALTVPEFISAEIIDLAREQNPLVELGARMFPVEGKTLFTQIKRNPVVKMHAENDSEDSEDSMGLLGAGLIEPRTMYCFIESSRELEQDSVNIAEVVRRALIGGFNEKLVQQILYGTGGKEVVGLIERGIHAEYSSNIELWETFIKAQRLVRESRAVPNGHLISPSVWEALHVQREGGDGAFIEKPQVVASVIDTPSVLEAHAWTGDFRDLYIGVRLDLTIERIGELLAKQYGVGYLASMRFDFIPAREASFVLSSTEATPS